MRVHRYAERCIRWAAGECNFRNTVHLTPWLSRRLSAVIPCHRLHRKSMHQLRSSRAADIFGRDVGVLQSLFTKCTPLMTLVAINWSSSKCYYFTANIFQCAKIAEWSWQTVGNFAVVVDFQILLGMYKRSCISTEYAYALLEKRQKTPGYHFLTIATKHET